MIESPKSDFFLPKFLDDKFNLAATYRSTSDFYSPHAFESHLLWQNNPNFDPNFDNYDTKTDFAAIIVSNCYQSSSGRLEYVFEMRKYVAVKIYGKCGEEYPSSFKNGTPGDFKTIIGNEFKFYLSFENAFCKDYITEKFFIILRYNIIPIVMGSGIHEDYIP